MAEHTNQEDVAIRYLLGNLSENEETSLEEQILSDDKVFETFEIAEGEVIDRYVRDELKSDERLRVDEMISSSPRLAKRVEIARIFVRKAPFPSPLQSGPQPSETPEKEKKETTKTRWWQLFGPTPQMAPAMRLVAVAPMVLFLLTSLAFVMVWTRYRTASLRSAQAEQRLSELRTELDKQTAQNNGLRSDLNQSQQQQTDQQKLIEQYEKQREEAHQQSPIFPLFLDPGFGTRSGGDAVPKVSIPAGTDFLEVQLNVETGDYPQYAAVLQNANANLQPILRRPRLIPVRRGNHKVILFKVPISQVPPNYYIIHVDGLSKSEAVETFNDYPFRITAH